MALDHSTSHILKSLKTKSIKRAPPFFSPNIFAFYTAIMASERPIACSCKSIATASSSFLKLCPLSFHHGGPEYVFNAHTWKKLLIFSMHGKTLFNICCILIKRVRRGGGAESCGRVKKSFCVHEICLGMGTQDFF